MTETQAHDGFDPPATRDPLATEALRWRCDPEDLDFETTDDLDPTPGVVGQPWALEALRFGLECDAPGQNVFVRGLAGTGRMTLVARMLGEMSPSCPTKRDRCYVHNFAQPDRPRLITLPAGRARAFRRRVLELAEFIKTGLSAALSSDAVKSRLEPLENRQKQEARTVVEPFEHDLAEAGLALVSVQVGPTTQLAVFPVVEGKPVQPEKFDELHAKGTVSDEQLEAFRSSLEGFQRRLDEIHAKVNDIRRDGARAIRGVIEETARAVVGDVVRSIEEEFDGDDVRRFLEEVVEDVAENRLGGATEGDDLLALYGVNILLEHEDGDGSPIVIENTPTLPNLLGTVERAWGPRGPAQSDYTMIRGGSLLRADGGYIVLDARDLLGEIGAWKILVRTLRSGRLEIVPADFGGLWQSSVKPEPIPIQLRVILLGDHQTYFLLDQHDPDFGDLFKVLADFDSVIEREPDGVENYQGVIARIAREGGLPPIHRTAVAALVEHGARIGASDGKLTARFARIADIAREAAYVARARGADTVLGDDIREAVSRTKRRAELPSRRFQELLRKGTIRIQTEGDVVGQVNGLAVMQAGPLMYGFPARITATIGAGSAGIVDIEGRSSLSGSIHTKGIHILNGLLRFLLKTEHPLAFSASLAFEQSYGGIDGDSASAAEIICLLSALTGVPIKQELAITGAIDQLGHLQAIGGVNEKIEGFFDTCANSELSGEQGVIIPTANAGDLMLRLDVVEACAEGRFRVYAAETIFDALEILTGVAVGERDVENGYPEGTLLRCAVDKALEYWLKSLRSPSQLVEYVDEEEEQEDEAPGD